MRVAQRGTSFISTGTYQNDEDSYTLDRWCLLSDGDNIADITQETSVVPDGAYAAMHFDVETIDKQFGIIQIIEARDTAQLWKNATGVVSLSFKARTTSSEIGNLRAAVLAWDGAADAVESNVASGGWNGAGLEPTWAANWTLENTPTNLALTNTYQTFELPNIDLDTAGTTNIAVFIWVDDDNCALTDDLYISEVQLEEGRYCTEFVRRSFSTELSLCQRYYTKTFDYDTTPVQDAGNLVGSLRCESDGVGGVHFPWHFPVTMRTDPSVASYNPSEANSNCHNNSDNRDIAVTLHQKQFCLDIVNSGAPNALDASDDCRIYATADAEL
jgi:hypothetical protein